MKVLLRGARRLWRCYCGPCTVPENIFGAMNTNKGITIVGTTINNLRYAYDTVLLAATEEDLQ